jgi:hypothetical protein
MRCARTAPSRSSRNGPRANVEIVPIPHPSAKSGRKGGAPGEMFRKGEDGSCVILSEASLLLSRVATTENSPGRKSGEYKLSQSR